MSELRKAAAKVVQLWDENKDSLEEQWIIAIHRLRVVLAQPEHIPLTRHQAEVLSFDYVEHFGRFVFPEDLFYDFVEAVERVHGIREDSNE